MGKPPLKGIKFGYSSAEKESARDPSLLTQGWFDGFEIRDLLLNHEHGLVLGGKGSGKSALGQHFVLSYEANPEIFVHHLFLRDFPFKSFAKIFSGDGDAQSKYPSSWAWILLLKGIDSIRRDSGSNVDLDPDFLAAVGKLEKAGLLPAADLKKLVITSSKTKFKAGLPQLLDFDVDEGEPATSQDLQFLTLIDKLKTIVKRFKGPNQHIVFLDGLDDILTSRDIQYESLAALIREVDSLNLEFTSSETPLKFVVLCRTDLFEKLPDPNKNKIRQDSAIELDWYGSPTQAQSSNLAKVVGARAKLSGADPESFWSDYFPSKVNDTPLLQHLLDHTRHTPRDLLQLLVYIQDSTSGLTANVDSVVAGLREYSLKYFYPEIKDELAGYLKPDEIEEMFRLLAVRRDRRFKISEFLATAQRESSQFADMATLRKTLKSFFDCGAIGNVIEISGGQRVQYTFKYRNRAAYLDFNHPLQIHRGLWKALNMA